MPTLAPWTEQWQHFQTEMRGQFWGDVVHHTRQSWQDLLGRLSIEARDCHLGVRDYERSPARTDARNGFYATAHAPDGVFCECAQRGADYFLHL